MKHITHSTKPITQKSIERNWHLVDAKGQVVGRIASRVALLLQGKNKTTYVSYLDCGDNVVIINAKHVVLTGQKWTDKKYTRYSGYPDGLKITTATEMAKKHPERLLEIAINGMLPKNKHRQIRIKRLHVYSENTHPFTDIKFVS